MVTIDKIFTNESNEHKEAKFKLFDRLVDTAEIGKEFFFVNQFGEEYRVDGQHWELMYMEAYSYTITRDRQDAYYSGWCGSCYNNIEEFKKHENLSDAIESCDSLRFDVGEYNKNIYTKEGNRVTYLAHPCSICNFKGKLKCEYIYDIALSRKGMYSMAIEVVKTSSSSRKKIEHSTKTRLPIIEVNYRDILELKDDENRLSCKSLWWYDESKNFYTS